MFEGFIRGENVLTYWMVAAIALGIIVGILSGFFKARKIQPRGFRWKIFGQEILTAVIALSVTGAVLGYTRIALKDAGYITFHHEPASWWIIGLEYAAFFFLFDAYFYWTHRAMHKEPIYRWVHKLHHRSTSPNVVTTVSLNPIEAIIDGLFNSAFLLVFTVHNTTMALIAPTSLIMGLYVHSGYEFLPRWWNKSWATKWFISATFHDQHHRYFVGNYGGFTTIWDRLCGTMRTKFEADFDTIKARSANHGRKISDEDRTATA